MISSARRKVERCSAGCVLVAVLAGGIPVAAPVAADDLPTVDEPTAPAGKGAHDGRHTMRRLPANLGRAAIGVFNKESLVPFLVGGAATGVSSFFDDNLRNSVSDPDSRFGRALETGGGWPVAVAVTGVFIGGRFAHGSNFRAMTYDVVCAAIVNFGYTELIKVTVRRERPDGSNNQSFPSGHASDGFAWATVLQSHYGWKWGAPGYFIAASVGYSRVVRDKHYLSDVVAGATLGYIVGRTVVRVNLVPLGTPGGTTLNVSPILGPHARGLQMSMTF